MVNDKMNRLLDLAKSTLNFHFDVPTPGKDGGKPSDAARLAIVLRKVLGSQTTDEVKGRAKSLVAASAEDPLIRRFFSQSSNDGIEAFLLMDEPEQDALLNVQPKPALNQVYDFLKENYPEFPKTTARIHEMGEWARQRQLYRHHPELRYTRGQYLWDTYGRPFYHWLRRTWWQRKLSNTPSVKNATDREPSKENIGLASPNHVPSVKEQEQL